MKYLFGCSRKRVFRFLAVFFLCLSAAAAMTRSEAMKELGITNPNFSDKDLKSAYRRRSLQTHPDKGGNKDEFIRVAEAFDILSGAGDGSTFSDFGGAGGGKKSEEAMRKAEEQFYDMMEDLLVGPWIISLKK